MGFPRVRPSKLSAIELAILFLWPIFLFAGSTTKHRKPTTERPSLVVDCEQWLLKRTIENAPLPGTLPKFVDNELKEQLGYAPKWQSCGSGCLSLSEATGASIAYELEFSADAAEPRVERTTRGNKAVRKLILSEQMSFSKLESQNYYRSWLLGSELHPYVQTKKQILREVQSEGIAAGIAAFDSGEQSFLYVAPTGTGKSIVLKSIAAHEYLKMRDQGRKNVIHLVLAHQTEILGQLGSAFESAASEAELKISKYLNEAVNDNEHGYVMVVTIQSFSRFIEQCNDAQLGYFRERLGVGVLDEAHHAGAETWLKALTSVFKDNPKSKFLGATATPVHRETKIQGIFNDLFKGKSFWAYLDHGKEGASIDRPINDVVKQLQSAIQRTELTPLGRFYALDPKSFDSEGKTIFQESGKLDSSRYEAMIKRLLPLLERHEAGFIAVSTREEADSLAKALSLSVPKKTFYAYHGDSANRAEIHKRMKNGERSFLISVGLLDEGVDYPHLSVYIDLNRSLGVRQLLQRWGRIARLSVGQEEVDILTLTDWTDADQIGDKLDLIEAFKKDSDAFHGSNSNATRRNSDVESLNQAISIEGAIVLDDVQKQEQIKLLHASMRQIFEQKNKASSAELLLARIRQGNLKVPSSMKKEEASMYSWLFKISGKPESEWPPESELREFIKNYRDNRKEVTSSAELILRRIRKGNLEFPSSKKAEEKSMFQWLLSISKKPESAWPSEPELHTYIKKYRENKRVQANQAELLLERIRKGNLEFPSINKKEEVGMYQWLLKTSKKDESEWPTEPELREFIKNYRDQRREMGGAKTLLLARIREGNLKIPSATKKEEMGMYDWLKRTAKKPESEWPSEPELREFIGKYRDQKQDRGAEGDLLARVRQGNLNIPSSTKKEEKAMYYWLLSICKKPEFEWPPEPELREFIKTYRDQKREQGQTVNGLLARIRQGNLEIPSYKKKEEKAMYLWLLKTSKTPESEWPPEPELRELIKKYRDQSRIKKD